MTWNTARTRQLLLDAAVKEFAEHGPQGARVDRVAAAAGVNKERIYQYFGSKQRLFAAVLEQELARLAADVPLDATHAADLAGYAGRVFDYHCEHPHFIRLLHWEGLQTAGEGGQDGLTGIAAQTERTAHYAEKVAAVAAAQQDGAITAALPAAELMYAVIALAGWWFATPQLAAMLMADQPDDSTATRRRALVGMIGKLAEKTPHDR